MKNNVTYKGKEKLFNVPKRKKRLKKGAQLFFSCILIVVFLLSSLGFTLLSVNFGEVIHMVNYDTKITSDYKVYLKENTHYETSYLGPGLEYISSLINVVNVDFDYILSANENLEYDYEYKISADLIITSKNEPDRIIFQENHILQEDEIVVNSSSVNISEDVDIDYVYFNNYVNEYKKEFGLLVDSYLVVTFDVIATGKSENILTQINSVESISVNVPLSEQTIAISNPAVAPESGYLSDVGDITVENYLLFALAIVCAFFGIVMIVIVVKLVYAISKGKDIYKVTINKYLREYDRMIVSTNQPDISENNFDNKIRVMSIEELIDAHDATGNPIIYYEVIPGEKSYFILMSGTTLYKLTISKAYLEEERMKNSRKK